MSETHRWMVAPHATLAHDVAPDGVTTRCGAAMGKFARVFNASTDLGRVYMCGECRDHAREEMGIVEAPAGLVERRDATPPPPPPDDER